MTEINVFFVNQPDGGDEPLNTFTCDDNDLPSTLEEVRKYVNGILADADKRYEAYRKSKDSRVEPICMHTLDKVVVNSTEFDHIPTILDITRMHGKNPTLLPRLKCLLEKYPDVVAVGFNGHEADVCGVEGDITIYSKGDNKEAIYNLCTEVSRIYNSGLDEYDSCYNIICAVFSGVDNDMYMLKKGVDW